MKRFAQLFLGTVFLLALIGNTFAGGPENLILVVNADSPSSLLIANHYIDLRDIPERNVIYLSDVPDREIISLKDFKAKILEPILRETEKRELNNSIDYIVYSADFPTIIMVSPHVEKLVKLAEEQGKPIGGNKKLFNGHASINSATYFAQAILQDEPGYMLLNSNFYYRGTTDSLLKQPFLGAEQSQYESAIEKAESKPDEAIAELEKLHEAHPFQVAVPYQLSKIHARQADYQAAADSMRKAISNGWIFRSVTEADKVFSNAIENSVDFGAVVASIPDEPFKWMPSVGFKRQRFWSPNGSMNSSPDQGRTYFLSTVLAVTRNYGCTESEALKSLKRNAVVDGTNPDGIFYFADTKDVRDRTRKPNYSTAIQALESMGQKTRVISKKIPIKQDRVMGLTNGTANFNWKAGGSTILPGAICDNLTSHGGKFNRPGQTKCTEFIAAGAAGASGTVIEPYAIQAKFPHPMIHAHYVRGCTLAEAFYQSVHGPFQLLIVGDALCQPFAKIPSFEYEGIKPESVVSGQVEARLNFANSSVACAEIELYIDGLRVKRIPPSEKLEFDSTKIPDGYHELRAVVVADNLLKTTGRVVFPIFVNNHGNRVNLSSARKDYKSRETVKLKVQSNYGDRIVLRQNFRTLAEKKGKDIEFSIPAKKLGRGPIELTAIALDENDIPVCSVPLQLTISGEIAKTKRQTEPQPAKK